MKIIKKKFGEQSTLFILKNDHQVELAVTDFGARIVSLKVPVDGELRETVLGFDTEQEYREADTYIGATIGRFAGRIKNGRFTIDGTEYQTDTDPKSGHTLHGGDGFDTFIWAAEPVVEKERAGVVFSLASKDGSAGFPGTLQVTVTYWLTNGNEWLVEYAAHTDRATLYNPTNHVYFNLEGDATRPVDEHVLKLQSKEYVAVDSEVIPTGEIVPVAGTNFDFTQGKTLGEFFVQVNAQSSGIDGLDHPFILSEEQPQAVLTSADSKVSVEMTTDDPAVVIFTANFGSQGPTMRGQKLVHHGGITLETQVPPGVTDYPEWGSAILRPEKDMNKRTIYRLIF